MNFSSELIRSNRIELKIIDFLIKNKEMCKINLIILGSLIHWFIGESIAKKCC